MQKEIKTIALSLLIFLSGTICYGQLSLPKVFGNHMILQRDASIPVWGKATPGEKITVTINKSKVSAQTDTAGNWKVQLPKMNAGGPFSLSVYKATNTTPTIRFNDVLIGDVWVASGQSNMEWQVQQSMNAAQEIKNADYPNIRLFNVEHNPQITPQEDVKGGTWKKCDSLSVKEASAVAYFFARNLHTEFNVPIGIIQSTWGGTPVEAWTSREALLSSTITRETTLQHDSITPQHFVDDSLNSVRFWDIVYNPQIDTIQKYANTNFDDSQWSELKMPSTYKDWNMPNYQGMVWLRKSIIIPTTMQGKALTLNLGQPEMNFSLYINGKEICKNIWNNQKEYLYTLPADIFTTETNVITIRLAALWGGGGLNPPAKNLYITDGVEKISLAGAWKYQIDIESQVPKINNYHQFHSYLFNGMINPIIPFTIKGFIWYQGENNEDYPKEYQTLFPLMINDWRVRWQQGYLPFIYVQLANYMKMKSEPSESNWAELREAQTLTLTQPNTGMACIIDIGEADNIHPKNKQEVARRLALSAKKLVYGKNIQASGPMYHSAKIEGNQIRITFDETDSGLTVRNNEALKGFAIAGNDGQFFWADAVIDGETVIVSSPKVPKPVTVRYAWADNPDCNLFNKEGLPAVPFRTDNEK